MSKSPDATDQKLLALLQEQGRIKKGELAEAVEMSIPAVTERIKRLEHQGVILGYHAHLQARKVGLEVMAFITLRVEFQHYDAIVVLVKAEAEILECHAMTGSGSHLLKVSTPTTASLERLLARIQSWPGIQQTQTNVVLSTHKETRVLPLQQLEPQTD